MEYLTVKEVAELKGCSEQYVKKIIKDGKLSAEQTVNEKSRPKYLIPVSALPQELQNRYYGKLINEAQLCLPKVEPPAEEKQVKIASTRTKIKKEFGEYSADEREQITFWTDLIREWRIRRQEYDSIAEGDMCFVAETKRLRRTYLAEHGITLSRDILYRKYRAYKENDLQGLIDNRGGWNKGKTGIPQNVMECFNALYLGEEQLPVSDCYKFTRSWVTEECPEYLPFMASERTFRRQTDKLPPAVVQFFRFGEKSCIDDCLPYIERLYDGIEANDVWVADNHTLDFVTRTDDGEKTHRLYVTGILDAKTEALVGWNITETPNSHSTVLALRHAIQRCGVPKILYVDNGREFLTWDIGGKGHRTRKKQADIDRPPTILDLLGIEMRNAIPRNGRAKPIERMFLTLKNTISRCVPTFTGGNIIERPESLKYQLKHGIVPYDWQIREQLDILFDGLYNADKYGGYERQFKGMSRAEAWCKSIQRRTLRMCDESTLNLMLMRHTGYQKVKENGVYITISGEKLWYNCGEENWRWVGREVYVRYDPAELEYVRIYDKEDTYIGSWQMDLSIFVDYITSDKGDIAARQRLIARQLRAIKECGAELTGGMKIDALALAVTEAQKHLGSVKFAAPKNIEPVVSKDIPTEARKAAGDGVVIDLEAMARNAMKRKITFDFEED
ncbi:MAG: Mu transposase C-terminal domain-containing protein [Oscillospiraceae bacterium]